MGRGSNVVFRFLLKRNLCCWQFGSDDRRRCPSRAKVLAYLAELIGHPSVCVGVSFKLLTAWHIP